MSHTIEVVVCLISPIYDEPVPGNNDGHMRGMSAHMFYLIDFARRAAK